MSNSLFMAEDRAQETVIRAQIEALETGLKLQQRLLDLKQNARRVLQGAGVAGGDIDPVHMALQTMLDCDIEVLTAERARTEAALVTYRAALQQQATNLMGALNLRALKPRQ